MSVDGAARDPRTRPAVQSVDRAVTIMEVLARDGWSGVTEIARELDIHKSTAFRLLSTLEARGIVEQHVSSQKYRLGLSMARLASSVRDHVDIAEMGRDACEDLSARVDETVNLAVLQDDEAVSIGQFNLSSTIISVDWVGQRHPLHVTATGKVFLAFGRPELVERHLSRPLVAVTPRTVTDPDELRRDLAATRERGYAITVGELEIGLNAVAAPILDSRGIAVAALVTSGPEYRLTPERLAEVGDQVRQAADTVSRRLGWLG